MSQLKTVDDLLLEEINDLYSSETQLVKALPKMARAAHDPGLRAGIDQHLGETMGHVERLEMVLALFGAIPGGNPCKAMKGLIEEGFEVITGDAEPLIRDLALIIAAQKIEHYEISGYDSARTLAEVLGHDDAAKLLRVTLEEEYATDEALTRLSHKLMLKAEGIHA